MDERDRFKVVGVRPDDTIGATLYCGDLAKARLFASLISWQNPDWKVTITGPDGNPMDVSTHRGS